MDGLHDDPEVLEYEISTFVYERRAPFDADAFGDFVRSWPESIIRVKGKVWLNSDPDMGYVFEQAGKQVQVYENGLFAHALPEETYQGMLEDMPELRAIWDRVYGDRMTQLCFIGRHMDRDQVVERLDACLTDWPGRQ